MQQVPLHAMLVHFPLVLGLMLPLAALGIVMIRETRDRQRYWLLLTVLASALAVSSGSALLSGEQDEERAERVVSKQAIERHETWGKSLATAGGFTALLFFAAYFMPRRRYVRGIALGAAVYTASVAVLAGHSGGQLVYASGLAQQLVASEALALERPGQKSERHKEKDDDDDDDDRGHSSEHEHRKHGQDSSGDHGKHHCGERRGEGHDND